MSLQRKSGYSTASKKIQQNLRGNKKWKVSRMISGRDIMVLNKYAPNIQI